jgi:hypothetical protein
MSRYVGSLGLGMCLLLAVPAVASADPLSLRKCDESASGQGGTEITVDGQRSCPHGSSGGGSSGGGESGPVVVRRVVDCGPVQLAGHVLAAPGDVCGQVGNTCAIPANSTAVVDPLVTTEAVQERQPDGSWLLVNTLCAVRTATPRISALVVTEQVRKLVPRPGIGVAPPGGATLVNIQTLLWVDTAADQDLATIALLGHRVALRIHVQRVDWSFGDGERESTDGPGRAYDPGDACRTRLCPGYWGHVYTATGPVTISATTTWSGEYNVDGTGWLAIAGTVTGPAHTTTLTVREARGVLVDPTNPTGR